MMKSSQTLIGQTIGLCGSKLNSQTVYNSKCFYLDVLNFLSRHELFYCFQSLLILTMVCSGPPCADMKSLRYVNSCPLTKTDWALKAKQKNCSSSSANICLGSPTKLPVYHCVPNEDGVGYAEICSQVFHSLSKY